MDLYGTAVVLEEFGKVMARGGSGVVIWSQSGHRLPAIAEMLDGKAVEWMEHVTDEQYGR